MNKLNEKLFFKTRESLNSVLPITLTVLILNFTIAPMPFGVRGLFLIGSVFLVLGMGLFTLGADLAMMPMGEQIGAQLTKSRNFILLIGVSLAMGIMITIAEPDLQVLANQVPSVPNMTLILAVAVGVGIFLVIALLRILFQWRLSYILIGLYLLVFIFGAFVPENFIAVAFDSGGVTTGPITVPFILALGVGISSVRGGKSSHDDSFGLVALCSVGPILAVMIMGMFFDTSTLEAGKTSIDEIAGIAALFGQFKVGFPHYFKEVAIALSPIVASFLLFQIFALKLPKSQLIKMSICILYTYFGLVLFLTGVNVGFLPAGSYIGEYIGSLPYNWVLIPLGMLMGFFIVSAEPAVHVLNEQVEDVSGGAISKSVMLLSLSIGVGISLGLAMMRIIFEISIWYIILPGYLIALALTLFVPKIFTAIAFDSGGVASGPMTATFLLPFAMGACEAVGGNIFTDAFGVVALVAMTPLITIQIIGLIYRIKVNNTEDEEDEFIEDIAFEIEEEEKPGWIEESLNVPAYHAYEEEDHIADNEYIDLENADCVVK